MSARKSAVLFIDFENLHAVASRQGLRQYADEFVSELIETVRVFVKGNYDADVRLARAYADFGELRGNGSFIQRALYYQGCEPVYVPSLIQANAIEVRLTVDIMETLAGRDDIGLVAIATGDRPYIPLVKNIVSRGYDAIVVCQQIPQGVEDHLLAPRPVYFEASELLHTQVSAADSLSPTDVPALTAMDYSEIDDDTVINTLEILEEHFGQYGEVYLTPLLRKLSEELEGDDLDPKQLVGELEEAGAVRLEKRKGFPYDYTVLIVNEDHPNVVRIKGSLDRSTAVNVPDPDDDLDDGDFEPADEYESHYDDEFDDAGWSHRSSN
jgi:hypothetical protein